MPGSSTVAVHADRDVHPSHAVAPPIYQTATFWAEDAQTFTQAAADRRGKDFYTRFGNPNHEQVAAVVAELEHTEADGVPPYRRGLAVRRLPGRDSRHLEAAVPARGRLSEQSARPA